MVGSIQLEREADLRQLAAAQLGVVAREELLALGLSPSAIDRRVQAGILLPMRPGIYRDVAVPRSWTQRASAAAKWIGEDGAVAGAAAAALHRLDGFGPPHVITLLTPRSSRSNDPLLKIMRTPYWEPSDRVEVAGIGTTSVARTLISLAGSETEERLEVALEDALRRRLTDHAAIADRLNRLPANQAGRVRLVRILGEGSGLAPTDSALEVRVIRLLRDEGYPRPLRQKVLDDRGRFVGRVDLAFPERRLILEVDGFRFHSGRTPWERDRERRNALTALGWVVLHVTARMLDEQRADFLRDLARAYHRPL